VAEELMMLSACVPAADKLQLQTGSPSNISGFFEHVRRTNRVGVGARAVIY